MALLYTFIIRLYVLVVRLAALWNPKAKEWIRGRKELFTELSQKLHPEDRFIWVHCSSAGEFEQGKPVIERIKSEFPEYKVLVSFFSPSGYHVARKYAHADLICYLPIDTPQTARKFVDLVRPELVIFVKYEYWYHVLNAAAYRHIPILLVSAIFRPGQPFFKWYGDFFRKILFLFRHIFVQDGPSASLLRENSIQHVSIAGDTRFDRVVQITSNFREVPIISSFTAGGPVLVAGSTWPDDEEMIARFHTSHPEVKLIIAPHEISQDHISQIEKLFPRAIKYSTLSAGSGGSSNVLIIDNIGMLSRLYHYATLSYIGGGFNKSGIHNTLEAAVYGKPVIFGPNYQKFKEARDLVNKGGGFSVSNDKELTEIMNRLLQPEKLKEAGKAAGDYVRESTGATGKILQFIQENRLLTR